MKSSTRILIAVAAVAVVVGWWLYARQGTRTAEIDLVEQFPQADHRSNSQPAESAFEVGSVTIDGQTKRTILAKPYARIIYSIDVPPDAWLELSFAMRPDSWTLPGDGAQFRVGISDGRSYEEILRQYVNPKRGDRRWISARLDLSAYEGRHVKLIFNTDPGAVAGASSENDLAVWGDPHIYSKR